MSKEHHLRGITTDFPSEVPDLLWTREDIAALWAFISLVEGTGTKPKVTFTNTPRKPSAD